MYLLSYSVKSNLLLAPVNSVIRGTRVLSTYFKGLYEDIGSDSKKMLLHTDTVAVTRKSVEANSRDAPRTDNLNCVVHCPT
jgi:hypothetical protein